MDDAELKQLLHGVRRKLRITKIVATRSVKGRQGDSFAGFAAAWESVQEDAGAAGAELIETMDEKAVSQGMSLHEAQLAHLLLAWQADGAATKAAMAGGNLSLEEGESRLRKFQNNYAKMIRELVNGSGDEQG